jgi:predicted GNAT family N-acyltransferase
MDITIKTPETPEEWEAYYDLRYTVMRAPLNQPRGSERHEGDAEGQHFALYSDGKLYAIARLDEVDETTAQVRFVAVSTKAQGKGFGRLIMDATEQAARSQKKTTMILHARDYALDFYLKLAYTVIEPSYKLFGTLQHYLMRKML